MYLYIDLDLDLGYRSISGSRSRSRSRSKSRSRSRSKSRSRSRSRSIYAVWLMQVYWLVKTESPNSVDKFSGLVRSSGKAKKGDGGERGGLWNNSRSEADGSCVGPAADCSSGELQTEADVWVSGRIGGGGGTASKASRAQPPPKRGQSQRASTAQRSK